MKVLLSWLAEWIDLPADQQELTDRLTFGGLELEDVLVSGPDLAGVRVGHVVECGPHPNADRLSVCRVDPGTGEPVDVVCGASNVAAGQKIAFAPTGVTLPDGTKLKKAKIRGVTSNGMICSERELGLSDEHEGILVLDAGLLPGTPIDEVLSRRDVVLDLEITPNRGDWASMLGVAREVRAHFGGEIRLPDVEPDEDGAPADDHVAIGITDGDGCFRYLGRVLRGVEVGASPEWLVKKLEAAGLRPINVVVDVTNLVLLEFGQPLHAFDLATLRGREIDVRRAKPDEKIATLDGQMRELDPGDLVIADAERAIAVAGVMGGAETEVRSETTDLLLECAHFDPVRVRKTARRLGLSTDASYRFERGVDPAGLERALDRAARLIAELAGGSVAPGRVEARGRDFAHSGEVELDPAHPNRLLGTSLSPDEVIGLLARVDIEARPAGDRLRCRIPSYRNDVAIAEDLIEEVARVYGYDRVPETLPLVRLGAVEEPARHALEFAVRQSVCGAGLLETRTFPGLPAEEADALGLAPDDPRRRMLRIANAYHEHAAFLPTTLVGAMLRAARHNLDHQVDDVRLFELARHFRRRADGELPDEPPCVAAVLTHGERAGLWGAEVPVFYAAKGVLERLFVGLGQEGSFRAECDEPYLHPAASAEVWCGVDRLGVVGELHPDVAARFGIDVDCAVFEIDLASLVGRPRVTARFGEVSRHPAVRRDVAVLLDRDRHAAEVIDAIRQTGGKHLVRVELFDRYEGKGVPPGRVSLAFRMVMQRPDRTLTDAEIRKVTDRVRNMLVHRFDGELR